MAKEIYGKRSLRSGRFRSGALRSRPRNSLLSHDLFESLFARAALITDIELLDDYPAHYDTYAKRQHRWTRGDWQILGWLFPAFRDGRGRITRNELPLISRWKILDNLRRSLVAPSIFLWLLAAWTLFPGSTLLWAFWSSSRLPSPSISTDDESSQCIRVASFGPAISGHSGEKSGPIQLKPPCP